MVELLLKSTVIPKSLAIDSGTRETKEGDGEGEKEGEREGEGKEGEREGGGKEGEEEGERKEEGEGEGEGEGEEEETEREGGDDEAMSVLELKSGHGILSQQLTEFTQHLHRYKL